MHVLGMVVVCVFGVQMALCNMKDSFSVTTCDNVHLTSKRVTRHSDFNTTFSDVILLDL